MKEQEIPFIDAHTHVQFSAYGAPGDRDAVCARAKDAGVLMINAGTCRSTSAAAVAFANAHAADGVYAAIGLHPVHTGPSYHDEDELGSQEGGNAEDAPAARGEVFDYGYYRTLALDPRTVAIGECGLDYFHLNDEEPREIQIARQKDAFAAQMRLSKESGKALMIHCRDAFSDLRAMLHAAGPEGYVPGVVHFFTGTEDDARDLLALGFSFTFGGAITFPPRKGASEGMYDGRVRFIPVDRIMSETDAPYVAPVPVRGMRNEPAYIPFIVARIAALKGISAEAMKAAIWENAQRVFGVKAPHEA